MTIFDMLGQSGNLTLLGMGVVFAFLIIMIITINLVGKLIHGLGMDKETKAVQNAAAPAATTVKSDGAVTAAISAAVNEYRKKQ
ncbi:MAG: OadG family protein [Treponema sp.]|jgi:oxaloacetate decarboxylase gamma subunit|nr:OadG family protein [Treponema sp.]